MSPRPSAGRRASRPASAPRSNGSKIRSRGGLPPGSPDRVSRMVEDVAILAAITQILRETVPSAGELDRVGEEVEQNLPQAASRRWRPRSRATRSRRPGEAEFEAGLPAAWRRTMSTMLIEEVRDSAGPRYAVDLQAAGLHACEMSSSPSIRPERCCALNAGSPGCRSAWRPAGIAGVAIPAAERSRARSIERAFATRG